MKRKGRADKPASATPASHNASTVCGQAESQCLELGHSAILVHNESDRNAFDLPKPADAKNQKFSAEQVAAINSKDKIEDPTSPGRTFVRKPNTDGGVYFAREYGKTADGRVIMETLVFQDDKDNGNGGAGLVRQKLRIVDAKGNLGEVVSYKILNAGGGLYEDKTSNAMRKRVSGVVRNPEPRSVGQRMYQLQEMQAQPYRQMGEGIISMAKSLFGGGGAAEKQLGANLTAAQEAAIIREAEILSQGDNPELKKRIENLAREEGYKMDVADFMGHMCYANSLYILLKENNANVGSYEDYLRKNMIHNDSIQPSGWLKNPDGIVAGYKIDGKTPKLMRIESLKDFDSMNPRIGIVHYGTNPKNPQDTSMEHSMNFYVKGGKKLSADVATRLTRKTELSQEKFRDAYFHDGRFRNAKYLQW